MKALSSRRFVVLWLAAFLSALGTWMERVCVGIHVAAETGQAGWTGLMVGLQFLPSLLFIPLGGLLADRFNRRTYLLIVVTFQLLAAASLAALALTDGLSLGILAVLVFITGCATALQSPAFQALLLETVPTEAFTSALALSSAQFNMARVAGPLLAALAIQLSGVELAFALNAMSFVPVLLALLLGNRSSFVPQRQSMWKDLQAGMQLAFSDSGIRHSITIAGVTGAFVAPFIGLAPAYGLHVLGASARDSTLLITFMGGGAVAAAVVTSTWADRWGLETLLRRSTPVLACTTALYWLSPTFFWALPAASALGMSYFVVLSTAKSSSLSRTPRHFQGRVSGIYGGLLDCAYALGVISIGAAGDILGLRTAGVLGALLFGVSVLALRRAREPVVAPGLQP